MQHLNATTSGGGPLLSWLVLISVILLAISIGSLPALQFPEIGEIKWLTKTIWVLVMLFFFVGRWIWADLETIFDAAWVIIFATFVYEPYIRDFLKLEQT